MNGIFTRGLQDSAGSDQMDFRHILEVASDCYVLVGHHLEIADLNVAAARWIGSPSQDILGRFVFDIFTDVGAADQAVLIDLLESGERRCVEIMSGSRVGRWVEANMLPTEHGTAVLFRDVTDRKEAELAGEKARDLLSSALNATTSEIAILDAEGRVLIANQAWHRFTARTDAHLWDNGVGQPYLDMRCLHPIRQQLAAYRFGIESVISGDACEFNLNFRTKIRGEYRNYRLRASSMQSSRWRRILVARDDVTELETALHNMDNMAVRLVNLQEDERQRYAAELHDSTVQHLTAASLNLMALRDRLPVRHFDELVSSVEESVEEAQREIRSVSYLLYPRGLDEDGLRPTLSRFASGFSARTGVNATLRVSGDIEAVPLKMKRTVLRIVQEALANVHRHANARTAYVALAVGPKGMSVCVSDDGIGLARDSSGKLAKPGVGITGMRARAHQFGGCLKVRSAGRGTLVFVRIPITAKAA